MGKETRRRTLNQILKDRPKTGYYTVKQAAHVLGVGEPHVYHLLEKHGSEYFLAPIEEGKKSMCVIPVAEVWKISEELDKVRPRYKRRRRGKRDGFSMPAELAWTTATPELRALLYEIRDRINEDIKTIPGRKKYTIPVIMWNIMAEAAQDVLERLKTGERVWYGWKYSSVKRKALGLNRSQYLVPRPIDIPDWIYRKDARK